MPGVEGISAGRSRILAYKLLMQPTVSAPANAPTSGSFLTAAPAAGEHRVRSLVARARMGGSVMTGAAFTALAKEGI